MKNMILDFGMSEDFLSGFTARHPVEYFFLCTQWWCAQEKGCQ